MSALPCAEQDGFVWVWPGWEEPTLPLPAVSRPPEGYRIHAGAPAGPAACLPCPACLPTQMLAYLAEPPAKQPDSRTIALASTFNRPCPSSHFHLISLPLLRAEIEVEVPVEHGLLVENLLDLAHAPFTHTSTFARGWPVPDAVKFHASRLLGGNWDPYPIEMAFQPPCMTVSHIGLARPGKAATVSGGLGLTLALGVGPTPLGLEAGLGMDLLGERFCFLYTRNLVWPPLL